MNAIVASIRLALFFVFVAPLLATPASADAVEDFYKGKTLRIIVGAPAGGVIDLYARAAAKYMPRYIPGNPSVIVQNIIGAGSVRAVNLIYNDLPPDGTVIGVPINAAPFLPLLGFDQARFDPKKMVWLGSPSAETSVLVVWHTVPVNSFDDLKTTQIIVGSDGPNATPAFFAKALNSVFNTKLKPVYGYSGIGDTMLAVQRGELQGYSGIYLTQLKNAYGNLIRDKQLKFLLQFGAAPNPELPGVPFVLDLIQSTEDKQLFGAVMAPLAIGYPFLMGPGIPEDRAAAMLGAVSQTFEDKDFLGEAKTLNLSVAPVSGAEIGKIISDSYAISPELTDRLRTLYNIQ